MQQVQYFGTSPDIMGITHSNLTSLTRWFCHLPLYSLPRYLHFTYRCIGEHLAIWQHRRDGWWTLSSLSQSLSTVSCGGPKVNTLSHNVTNKLTVAGSDFGKEWQFIAIYGAPQRWEGRGRERSC